MCETTCINCGNECGNELNYICNREPYIALFYFFTSKIHVQCVIFHLYANETVSALVEPYIVLFYLPQEGRI